MPQNRRIIHVQPALPKYRLDFFDRISQRYGKSMIVYYSPGSLGALTKEVRAPWAVMIGCMRQFPMGLAWQAGVFRLALTQGDVVVLSGNPRQLSTLFLLLRAKWRGSTVVWWGHYWSSTSRRWRQILRYLPMRLADALLFYTDDEVAAFRADPAHRMQDKHVSALNNGLNTDPIRTLCSAYRAQDRQPALLFIGRLTAKANLSLAIDALARMGPCTPILHVIGEGEEMAALKGQAESLGLKEKIRWHGAITVEADIAAIANQCRVFIYPGEVGLSLIHAMAYALPAVVHDERRRHMPEIAAFKAGRTGLTFARDDAEDLARTLTRMIEDPALLQALSVGTKQAIEKSFSTADMAARFVALVDSLETKK